MLGLTLPNFLMQIRMYILHGQQAQPWSSEGLLLLLSILHRYNYRIY